MHKLLKQHQNNFKKVLKITFFAPKIFKNDSQVSKVGQTVTELNSKVPKLTNSLNN